MRPAKPPSALRPPWAGGFLRAAAAALVLLAGAGAGRAAEPIKFPESAALPPGGLTPDTRPGPRALLPQPLPETDAWRYHRIFQLQSESDWRAADRLIADLGDPRLLGHVLAQRYLNHAYKPRFAELADWLDRFADHPDAAAIRALAVSRWPAQAGKLPQPLFQGRAARRPELRDESDSRYWAPGLAAWRKGDMKEAAEQFERMAQDKASSDWERSAGAYWTARAHLRNREPELVNQWLKMAAEYPRTFYGQLARKRLGLDIELVPAAADLTAAGASALLQSKVGQRVLALVQIGEDDRAAAELENLPTDKDETLRRAVVTVSEMIQMPQLAFRLLAESEAADGKDLDAALYPVPAWKPRNGFTVDRALLYAIVRQESAFNPRAVSPSGAVGLMQLLPSTAGLMAGSPRRYAGKARAVLFDPALNLTLGQRYVAELLDDPLVDGDLIRLGIAYNAGPGFVAKWRADEKTADDPLLFLATLPVRETRVFVERVLANYWIYQQRLGQDSPSLDALVAGEWPRYQPQDAGLAAK